ncbi:MAG: hypothetical protein ABWY34_09670 [Pseudoxanthomonas sp.]
MERRTPAVALALCVSGLMAVACASCTSAPAASQPQSTPSKGTPSWLAAKIREYEKLPLQQSPSGIWRISHDGKPAYYVQSPCCDQYNPLFSAEGSEICNPSGGFTGRGDGKCPAPMDRGSQSHLVWAHPAAPPQTDAAPGLQSP